MTGPSAVTRDRFLDGRLEILQPKTGYRAGTDPVLLAAAVPAKPGEHVLELGCGVGVAALCLALRAGAHVTGLELQSDYAELARRNASAAGLGFDVVDGDVARPPARLRDRNFDHVFFNPPYFATGGGTPSEDAGRERANRESLPLADWMDAGLRRLRPGGTLTVLLRSDRLPDVLAACTSRLGRVRVKPLSARSGYNAKRVIVQGLKGSRTPFELLPPLVLHDGAAHQSDEEGYSKEAEAILRKGAALGL